MPVDMLEMGLRLLDFSCNTESLEGVLRPIAAAAAETAKYFESLSEEEAEFRVDELETIENLLGCAFVMCQTHMSGVISRLDKLDRYVKAKTTLGVALMPSGQRHEFLRRGCATTIGSYTAIQILWSLANYFKHRDEWPLNWDAATGKTKSTINVIAAAGLSQGSTGNLRTGAEALGVHRYSDLDVLIDLMENWSGALNQDVRAQLGR